MGNCVENIWNRTSDFQTRPEQRGAKVIIVVQTWAQKKKKEKKIQTGLGCNP